MEHSTKTNIPDSNVQKRTFRKRNRRIESSQKRMILETGIFQLWNILGKQHWNPNQSNIENTDIQKNKNLFSKNIQNDPKKRNIRPNETLETKEHSDPIENSGVIWHILEESLGERTFVWNFPILERWKVTYERKITVLEQRTFVRIF